MLKFLYFHQSSFASILCWYPKVGDTLPDVNLYEESPDNAISASRLYRGKKGVLFAVLGAFTPGCTNVRKCGKFISCFFFKTLSE